MFCFHYFLKQFFSVQCEAAKAYRTRPGTLSAAASPQATPKYTLAPPQPLVVPAPATVCDPGHLNLRAWDGWPCIVIFGMAGPRRAERPLEHLTLQLVWPLIAWIRVMVGGR